MKKKILKTTLAGLAIAPCLFLATGCNKDGGSTTPPTVTPPTEAQMFDVYKSANKKFSEHTGSLTMDSVMDMYMVVPGSMEYSESMHTSVGYNDATKEYYQIKKDKYGIIESSRYVKKVNDSLVDYTYDVEIEDDYAAYKVDADFVKNLMDSDELDLMTADGAEDEDTTLTEYISNLNDLMVESVTDMSMGAITEDLLEGTSPVSTYKITLTDNVYTFTYDLEQKVTDKGADAASKADDVNHKIQASFVSTYTADGIKSLDQSFSLVSSTGELEKETLALAVGGEMNYDIEYSYIDAIPETMSADDYPTVTNNIIEVEYYLDGEHRGEYNHEYTTDVNHETIAARDNTTFNGKWYLDEACTQEFTATKYPSHDIKLYGKSTPSEGYSIVVYNYDIKVGSDTHKYPIVQVTPVLSADQKLTIADGSSFLLDYVATHNFKITSVIVNGQAITLPETGNVEVPVEAEKYYNIEVVVTLTEKPAAN